MFSCNFVLNGNTQSDFEIIIQSRAFKYPAFSGHGQHTNRRTSSCLKGVGPIPPGRYYILDRYSGGRLEWLRNLFSDHSQWFALYAIDNNIDDETQCDQITRGNFRLHPRGTRGISNGCITIQRIEDFHELRLKLKSKPPKDISGTSISAYGIVEVR